MNILILSQYYLPENTLIPSSLAVGLAGRGHQVRVLTGYPNYPNGILFEGYHQKWRMRETHDAIEVLRVPLWADHSLQPYRRILNYTSFALSATTAGRFARGADVVYVYAPQMSPALAPWIWRLLGGAPYVLHVQDLWPDSILGSSITTSGAFSRAVNLLLPPWLESVYRHAGAVIGIAPTMVDQLIDRGVAREKAHLVYNWAPEFPLTTAPSAEEQKQAQPGVEVLYAGNIGDMQDLETAILAIYRARGAGVRLTIVGDGVALQKIKLLVEEIGADNVSFHGSVPLDRVGEFYKSADFALVTLKDRPNFRGTVPSKLQAALSYGVPVISTVQGDVRRLVETLAVGFTADAESPDSLGRALSAAAGLSPNQRYVMGVRAKSAYLRHFSRAAAVAALERILIGAAGGSSHRGPSR